MTRALACFRAWLHVSVGLSVVLLVWGVVVVGQTPEPTLTEVQRLKAQLQQAQEQLLQAQYQLATCQAQARAGQLADGRRQLEQELVPAGYVLDWVTLTLRAAPK